MQFHMLRRKYNGEKTITHLRSNTFKGVDGWLILTCVYHLKHFLEESHIYLHSLIEIFPIPRFMNISLLLSTLTSADTFSNAKLESIYILNDLNVDKAA